MVSSSASQHSEESRLMMGETLSGPSNCTKPEKQPSCKRSSQLAFRSDIWENVETCFPIHSIAQYPSTSVFLSSQKSVFLLYISKSPRVAVFVSSQKERPKPSWRLPSLLPMHQMNVGYISSDASVHSGKKCSPNC